MFCDAGDVFGRDADWLETKSHPIEAVTALFFVIYCAPYAHEEFSIQHRMAPYSDVYRFCIAVLGGLQIPG